MKITNKHTFFWNDEFSNWHPSEFTVQGMTFNCGEQWMMYGKAKLFGDDEAAALIMNSKDPREIKKLGKTVKNFDLEEWTNMSHELVKLGLREKYMQNEPLYLLLMSTGDTTLVEASPYDKIWGIGMSEDHPDVNDESKWQGENRLGVVLTELRDEFSRVEASDL
jgi:hypothetical protein